MNNSPQASRIAGDSRIVPIVLAAGASTRMGRPKALCEFSGRACLELALDACHDARLARPIVVLGYWADEIRARVSLADATVVVNQRRDRGQTSSLKAGLQAVPAGTAAFLLYPVDYPLLTALDIGPLVAARRARRRREHIFAPSHNGRRGHPVLFDLGLCDEFLSLDDETPARSVLEARASEIRYVGSEAPYVLMDMDTPEDYARCLAAYRRRAMGPNTLGHGRRPSAASAESAGLSHPGRHLLRELG